ncbi:MAG TPA: hypothetical protein PK598_12785, partial [Thermoanaerobaculia bacterium]|nr:hypothetical protein [Thermoanaerobaculia bacterium]
LHQRLARHALDLAPPAVGLVHLSRCGVPGVDEAEARALAAVFAEPPRTAAVKEGLGENPCVGAVQLALAVAELAERPDGGAVLVNAFGAGGNFLSAVFSRP